MTAGLLAGAGPCCDPAGVAGAPGGARHAGGGWEVGPWQVALAPCRRSLTGDPSLLFRPLPSRYWLEDAPGPGRGQRQDTLAELRKSIRPGQLTDGMRRALGLGPLDPPPWLHRMRQLGIPPAYRAAAPMPESGASAVEPARRERGGDGDLGDFVAVDEHADNAEAAPRTAVRFPGVNGPIPDGADPRAWGDYGYQDRQPPPPTLDFPREPEAPAMPPPPGPDWGSYSPSTGSMVLIQAEPPVAYYQGPTQPLLGAASPWPPQPPTSYGFAASGAYVASGPLYLQPAPPQQLQPAPPGAPFPWPGYYQ